VIQDSILGGDGGGEGFLILWTLQGLNIELVLGEEAGEMGTVEGKTAETRPLQKRSVDSPEDSFAQAGGW